jgi:LuxR family maltose regulon positive regulatory protein
MLRSPQTPSAKSILTLLINEITAIPGRIILVLDDYHLISAAEIDEALTFLLENLPPQLHMIITTRVDPQLPLARLRASGQLTELRGTELRFTSSEVSDFINGVMDLELSIEDLTALEIRTEGWIAGLQLAAISMQGHENTSSLVKSFTGSHRLVLDYLIEEVLERQPELVQNFLMKTAVLKRFTGSLCDALTGQNDGQTNLEMLDHANLFIVPLDEERHWYRYHHLFADLLRQRLHKSQPGDIPYLHHRASLWYGQNGFSDEAIEHALHSDDMERALSLVEEQVDLVWERGEHTKLWRWLAGLPAELVHSSPQLCIFRSWNMFTLGQQDKAERFLHTAEKALGVGVDLPSESPAIESAHSSDPVWNKIKGRAATVRAYLAFHRGDIEKTNTYSHQALEFLPEEDDSWRCTALVALGDAYNLVGDLSSARQFRSEALAASVTSI